MYRQKMNSVRWDSNLGPYDLKSEVLFVLRFYGPVNPMGSCRAWSPQPSDHQSDTHPAEPQRQAESEVITTQPLACFNFQLKMCLALRHAHTSYTEIEGYPLNIFLISPSKHTVWVLIRSALEYPECIFS